MVKVAACGSIELEGGDLRSALERCAVEAGVECSLEEHANPADLVEACSKALAEEPYNLVICAVNLAGVSGVHTASELKDLHAVSDDLRLVLCSASSDHAFDAHAHGVNGYLVEPVSQADFNRVVGRQLRELALVHGESVVVRCRDRARRIVFSRLAYAETADHDQVLHHIGTKELCSTRCSSRELFAILEGDGRFFKVGSSYIVNLDYVKRLDLKAGMAELVDGAQIPIPVRVRRPLERALLERGEVVM